ELDLARHQHRCLRAARLGRQTGTAVPQPRADLGQLALVDPDLDADDAVGRPRLREPVIDVAPQRVQRKPPFKVPFRTGDLRPAEAARHPDLDALGAETQGRLDRLSHRAPERHPLLELDRDRLAQQLRLELRLEDLLDVDEDLAPGLLLYLVPQLVDL